MIVIVMAYDKSQDYDDDDDDDSSDTGGMNGMIFRSKNIFYNQHHDTSHLLHLHDDVLMVVTMVIIMITIITMIYMINTMVIIIKV